MAQRTKFPKLTRQWTSWIRGIEKNGQEIVAKKDRICAQHFDSNDFEEANGRKLLKENIKPSIFNFDPDSLIQYETDDNDASDSTTTQNEPTNVSDVANIVKALQCQKCDFLTSSINILMEHVKIHDPPDPKFCEESEEIVEEILVCSICYGQYSLIEELKKHMIKDHNCIEKIRSEKDTTKPKLQENKENKESNDKPDDDDANSNDTDSPEEDATKPVPFKEFKLRLTATLMNKCSAKGCFYKFESREKQEQHVKCHCSTDPEKVRDFKCIECTIEFKTWRNCSSHMWKEHKIDVDLLNCPICSYKAITCTKVWRHMRVHGKWRAKVLRKKHGHKDNRDKTAVVRWYTQKTCDICGRIFANSKTLSKHVKVVHNKIKPFICNVCGRKSARKSTWIVHMRQHTGERPYQCKSCPFKASDSSVLTKHEMRHSKISRYKCALCNYCSIQSSSYKNHMKFYHPEEFKKISCDQCNYISVNPDILEAHKKDHKKGLIQNEDSSEAMTTANAMKSTSSQHINKPTGTVEISSDCFLPLESTDSIVHDPSIDTGGVTIPAHSEDTQFPPTFMQQ